MNMMMFPKMLSSHDEGWKWLADIHPSVAKVFALYVVPMALIPPAMVLYAVSAYGDRFLTPISMRNAWTMAILFYACELLAVPVMAAVIQRLGDIVDARPTYHDAFAFSAAVPTPLWLSPLALFVPSLALMGMAMTAALFISGILIYRGSYQLCHLSSESQAKILSGAILAAGLVGWVSLMIIAFVSWGWVVT